MNSNFDAAFQYLLQDESTRYTNDPNDPGGPTKFGITLMALQSFLGRPCTALDVENLSEDLAKQIHAQKYWAPLLCDSISNAGVATCLFDTGVLYGVGSTAMIAQKAAMNCGAQIKIDGIFGEESVNAVNALNQKDFIQSFYNLILARIEAVISAKPDEEKYRRGWEARAQRLLTLSDNALVMNQN